MKPTTFLGLWAIAAYILYRAIASVAASRRRARMARERGCKPAPAFNKWDVLGIHNVRMLLRADREKRLPEYSEERVATISAREGRHVTTMRNVIAGEESFFTIEPRNIQAILATQFKDFELGERRNGNFQPLLGHGIVSDIQALRWWGGRLTICSSLRRTARRGSTRARSCGPNSRASRSATSSWRRRTCRT